MIWLLLILFELKHFICDYPLQTEIMLKKGSAKSTEWIPALLVHCLVHSMGAMLVCIVFIFICSSVTGVAPTKDKANVMFYIAFVDFILHFVIDRIKAHPKIGGRWKSNQKAFWNALGLDQAAHHLCQFGYIYLLTR